MKHQCHIEINPFFSILKSEDASKFLENEKDPKMLKEDKLAINYREKFELYDYN